MARPKNPQRTADLLAAAAEVVQRLGIAGTTLRPLATELGVAPRTLLYHFDSKENLLVEVIRELRHQQPHLAQMLAGTNRGDIEPGRRLGNAIERLWDAAKRPEARPFLALYFEITSLAIRDPEQYRPLLIEVDQDWVDAITNVLVHSGTADEDAHAIADALLIDYRGAVCFALATGRWDAAESSITELIEATQNRMSAFGKDRANHTTQS